MSDREERGKFYDMVACGNAPAREWLILFHDYCHEIDDVIDENDWDNERVLGVFIAANTLYSHPFYCAHHKVLGPCILIATSVYVDSNKWEKDPAKWKKWWAEVMRHSGNEVIFAVANICGGWKHLRYVTAPLYASCYVYHADKYGTPDSPKT